MPRDAAIRAPLVDAPLIGTQLQQRWDVHHATWFTLMGVGGGIFLLSRLLDLEMRLGLWLGLPLVDLLSFAVIAVGGLILVADLGRPLRFIRAVMKPGTSWISRGAIADFIFLVTGGILVLPDLTIGAARPLAWLPWDAAGSTTGGRAIEALAVLSAAVVIYYAGQVLADFTAIPYWRSPAIPIQFVLSSLAISMTVIMVMEALSREPIGAGQLWLLVAFLAGLLVTIAWHLRTDIHAPGKVESVEALLRGRLRIPFLAGVVGAGTALPIALALIGLVSPRARGAMGALSLLCTLPAGFWLRLATLRVGFFPPVHASIRLGRR
jgi:formate-dependent nitrite reductase membrane component NrfD